MSPQPLNLPNASQRQIREFERTVTTHVANAAKLAGQVDDLEGALKAGAIRFTGWLKTESLRDTHAKREAPLSDPPSLLGLTAHAAERQLHERIALQQAKGATEHKGRMDDLLSQVKTAQERVAELVEREHEQAVKITRADADAEALRNASQLLEEQVGRWSPVVMHQPPPRPTIPPHACP